MAERIETTQIFTDSNNRCMKCVFVVLEVFPKIIQRIMEKSVVSAEIIYQHIQNDQCLKTKLTPEDHQVIQTLLSDGYSKLDLTLMFKIITHYSNMFVNPPTRGWGSHLLPSEITIGDDTLRLRLKRNHFLHKVNPELSAENCNEFFSEVTMLCERVDRFLNCTEEDSFKLKIETLKKQTFISTEELKKKYNEERKLEEFFVAEMADCEFRVYKAKSLKIFIQELKDRQNDQKDNCSVITLTFPDIDNPTFTKIMSDLREEINSDLVNIKVEKIQDGSLVVNIMMQTADLLDDEVLRSELSILLTRFLTIKKCQDILKTLPTVTIVMSDCFACFGDSHDEIIGDKDSMYSKGSLQLNLTVNNTILQTEEMFKSEMEILFDTIVSKSNGNIPFDKPVVSIIEPSVSANQDAHTSKELLQSKPETQLDPIIPQSVDTILSREKSEVAVTMDDSHSFRSSHLTQMDSDKALNTTSKEPENRNRGAQVKVESINLQLLNRSNIRRQPFSYKRTHCCTLPNGLMVFGCFVDKTLFITKTDGTLHSTVEVPLDYFIDDFQQHHSSYIKDMTSTGGNCVAFSSDCFNIILIIDVIKKEIVKWIKTSHCPVGITFEEGYFLYCDHRGYIVKLDIDNGKERSAESCLLIENLKDKGHSKCSEKTFPSERVSAEEIVYDDISITNSSKIVSCNNRIYYSGYNYTVTVLDSKYNVIYKCNNLKNLTEITIDHHSVVYVVSLWGNNLSAISSDGKIVRVLLDKENYLISPSCVHYDRYTQQLIVVDEESVLRYSINMS